MYQSAIISCLATFALALGGCGGGGGGSSVVAAPPVRPTTTVTSNGISQDASFTASTTAVTSVTDQGVSKTGVSASITTYDDDGTIQKIAITTPSSTLIWDATSGDIIDNTDVVVVATNAAETNIGLVINTENVLVPWEYQTFGIWETGIGTGIGTVGAITVGTPTTGSAIPTTGNASFVGISGGMYLDAAGTTDYITASALFANVNFLKRSIALTTTTTLKVNTVTAAETTADNLNMTGTLTYLPNTNSFTGDVSAAAMTGTSTGQFYGPTAEELGGVFSLEGAGVESYVGAYGAQKQ